jgi:hypothetical protein
MKASRTAALVAALLLGATACQDLQVDNLINPDRTRATGNPGDLEAFIGSAFFPTMFASLHGRLNNTTSTNSNLVNGFPLIGSEFTATLMGNTLLMWNDFKEPRERHDNGALISVGNGPHGPRQFWASSNTAASIAFDGLQILNETGMTISEGGADVTPRAKAFAKFIQGWAWGIQAIVFDRAHYIPETMTIPASPSELAEVSKETLVDWSVLLEHANPTVVSYPAFSATQALWFGSQDPISNDQFIRMANTLSARLIVLSARTPAERAALPWSRVEALTAEGLTSDFRFALSSPRGSLLLQRSQQNNLTDNNHRLDYRGTVGLADQSGAFQAWLAADLLDRQRFDVVTPDRRITGPTATSSGSYVRYRANDTGFTPDRGLYLYSAYQFGRHAISRGLTADNQPGHNQGSWPLISKVENDLLRAEALYYLNRREEAAGLVNLTRTAPQTIGGAAYPGLPPVTAAGVPTDADGYCVPRQESGACGTLLTAIRYERMLELIAMDAIRGFADSRGWGILPNGTILSWPVPGNALDLYKMEPYSYGGVGEPNTATYAPVN